MKIVFLTPEYVPYVGGISHVTKEFADELAVLGHEVVVITRNLTKSDKFEVRESGVKVHRLPHLFSFSAYISYVFFSIMVFWKLLFLKADLVHSQSFLPLGIVSGIYSSIFSKTLSVTQGHGKDINKELVGSRILRPLSRFAIRKNDVVFALCNYHGRLIEEYSGVKAKLLANGVDLEKGLLNDGVDLPRVFLRSKDYSGRRVVHLLFVGRLIKRKGADILLESARLVLNDQKFNSKFDLKIHIIGEGPEYLSLKQLASDLRIELKVFFHGNMDSLKVLSYMKACDTFVFPTHKEAFGLVVLEAMKMKLPIICSKENDVGGPVDILENGKTALLVDRTAKSFAQGIMQIFDLDIGEKGSGESSLEESGSYFRNKLSKNAFETVMLKYSWNAISKGYLNIISEEKKRN